MPKAKQVASQKIAAKQQTKAAPKAIAKKQSQTKQVKTKAAPIKEASKPIKKAAKAEPAPPVVAPKAAKQKRPSNPPKKPGHAYNLFSAEMQGQMKDMPKFKAMPFQQRSQVVAQSWQKLNDTQKQPYNSQAEEEKKRYLKEVQQFEKLGWFRNKDGQDSRDFYKAPRAKDADTEMDDETAPKKKSAKDAKEEKKVDDVCKPKKIWSLFFFFQQENRVKVLKENPGISIGDLGKKNGEDWKNVSDQQKKKYEEMQKKDTIRFNKEMKEFEETGFYTDSNGVNSKFMDRKHRVREFPIGTIMPKIVATSYMCFSTEQQRLMRDQKKDDEKTNVAERMKLIAKMWNEMTAVKKAKYEKLHEKDQERYNKQLDEIRKNGFFTTDDGVKSTDLKQKVKRVKKAKRNTSTNKE